MASAPARVDGTSPALGRAPGAAVLAAIRPWLFLAAMTVLVALFVVPDYHPASALFEYLIRVTVAGLVLVGAVAWGWARWRGGDWDADLLPALVSGIVGLTLAGSLNRTPFAPGGLSGDQAFRTAAITRFADSWHSADFTFQGLPSFYAPAYFWVLGRASELGGIEPWRMAKYGTIAVALLVPVVTYLLWRRLVPIRVAALIAVVPLAVENFYEPYAWLVLFAIVPWWLEAVPGLRRPGRRIGHPVFLGLVGAALFLTYYYFFFIAALAFVIYLGTERLLGELRWRQVGRAALVLAVAAVASACYWLPLLLSIARADHPESLANRWFSTSHPSFPLPMWELSVAGGLSLLGLGYLVWAVRREALARGLLVFLTAAYGWYLIGAPAAIADTPLLTFRGKPLIPMILLIAGVLALVRVGQAAAHRFSPVDVRRVAVVGVTALVVFLAQGFVTVVRDSPLVPAAHSAALPDGTRPPYADAEEAAAALVPPAADLHQAISDRQSGPDHPVLLSDRVDILAFYPYYGFLQWNAHYAHPAAQFRERVDWLTELAGSDDPASFARQVAENPFEPIDAFVLRAEGEWLTLRFSDDDFPRGLRTGEIRFPRALFADFELVELGDYVLAVLD